MTPDFFRALEASRTQAIVDRDMPAMALLRDQATITFPSGRVVLCWHTGSDELRGGAWQAVWSQATQLPPA